MISINKREVEVLQYDTSVNWSKNIPKENWVCILVDNNRTRNYIYEVISKIINNNVCYVCTVGHNSELNHDLVDEEIVFREADISDHYLPRHTIMTSWHNDFSEGVWFGIFATNHEEVNIDKVLILDMTEGKELHRITTLLEKFQSED